MKEYNQQTLKDAINRLPGYHPPFEIWDGIANDLNQEDLIAESIERLPTYAPPAKVWDSIEQIIQPKPMAIRRSLRRWSVAASFLLVLTSASIYFYLRTNRVTPLYEFEMETVSAFPMLADWDEDDAAFEEAISFVSAHSIITDTKEFQDLKTELEELNEAKLEIKEIMADYGVDPSSVQKMKQLELERNEVVKAIAALY